MAKNAIIIAHFGSNERRIELMRELIKRMLAQKGDKVIYVVENLPPGIETRISKSTLQKVTYVRVSGIPAMWQKEGSFNAGAKKALSDRCDNLIFMDSDIIPENIEWLKEVEEELETSDWVHCGRKVCFMTKAATAKILKDENKGFLAEDLKKQENIEYSHDSLVFNKLNNRTDSGFPGGIWAVNKKAWEMYIGWDVHSILGGGDRFHFLRLFRMRMGRTKEYGNLREILFDPLLDKYFGRDPKWKVAYTNSTIFHLWHGSPSKRSYSKRFKCLVKPGNDELMGTLRPRFSKDQLIDFNTDVKINADGLVDLNEKSKFYEWFLTRFTEYFMSREDVDADDVNIYLEYMSAKFRVTKGENGSLETIPVERHREIKGVLEEVKKEEDKERERLGIITEREYETLGEEDPYYKKSRWEYLSEVTRILIEEAPFGRILELGAYKRPVIKGSDTMDVFRSTNLTYFHDATKVPWPIKDSTYDLFIALQVWEHLGNRQKEAFGEVIRVANRAVMSFPLNWNCPGNCHHGITEEKIAEWTHHIEPLKKIKVGKKNPRVIYLFRFDKKAKSPRRQDEADKHESNELKRKMIEAVHASDRMKKKVMEEKEKNNEMTIKQQAKIKEAESKKLADKMKKLIQERSKTPSK